MFQKGLGIIKQLFPLSEGDMMIFSPLTGLYCARASTSGDITCLWFHDTALELDPVIEESVWSTLSEKCVGDSGVVQQKEALTHQVQI